MNLTVIWCFLLGSLHIFLYIQKLVAIIMLIILEDNLQNLVPWATDKAPKICAALTPPPLHHHHHQQQQQRRRRQQQQHSQTNHIYMLRLTESLSHTAPSSLTFRPSQNSKTRFPYLQHHTSHSRRAPF